MESREMNLPSIPDSEKTKLIAESNKILTTAKSIKINSDSNFKQAGEFLKRIKTVSKSLTESRLAFTRPIDEKKKEIMGFFKQPQSSLDEAESIIKSGIVVYNKKKEAEAQKLYEENLKKQKAEEDRLKKEAAELRDSGQNELAEIKEKQADDFLFTTPTIPINQHKTSGISTRTAYSGEVIDKTMLFRWLLENQDHIDILEIHQGRLNRLIQATKGSLPISGVKISKEEIVSARSV